MMNKIKTTNEKNYELYEVFIEENNFDIYKLRKEEKYEYLPINFNYKNIHYQSFFALNTK